ncbi:MAG: DUF2997 domain-containing protein [Candidatus Bathyarchaeia archaeon]
MGKKIIVNIGTDGVSTLSVLGAKGGECLKMTEKLERSLGNVNDVKLTDDYYAALENTAKIQEKQ